MNYVKVNSNKKITAIYPEEIRKQTNFDGRTHKTVKHTYKLIKVYPYFALYQNSDFENIMEAIDKFELKNNTDIEIISKGDYFEDEYYDIWECEENE